MRQIPTIFYLNHTARLSGGEIALVRTLAALDRECVRPFVVLAEDGPLVERLKQLGVEHQVLPLSTQVREVRKDSLGIGAITHLRSLLYIVAYAAAIARLARTQQASLFHTNSLKADIYGILAGRLAGVPVLWHVRDHIDPSYLPAPAVVLFRLFARMLPAFVVSNSQSTENCLHLPNRVRKAVIYDGLGADEVAELAPRDLDRIERTLPFRIGIIGRLAPWKGQHVFLEAAARLLAADCQVRFFIIGSPLFGEADYEAGLRRQAATLGIEDAVEFQGFRADMPEALKQLDLLIHASIIPEPFGQVIIEGMAAGLPVIATNGGGVREIIQHGENGILVPMADAVALADAIQELLRNPGCAQRLGAAGRTHVEQSFTAALTARRLEGVYESLLADRPNRKRFLPVNVQKETV